MINLERGDNIQSALQDRVVCRHFLRRTPTSLLHGLRCLNLTHGVHDFHSPDERIAVADLEAMVDVTVALVEGARAA